MNLPLKSLLAAGLLASAVGLSAAPAQAMPNGLDPSVATSAANDVEAIRWVCGPYRCRWVPNYWAPRPYWGGPRRYWGGYGYRGRWAGGPRWRRW